MTDPLARQGTPRATYLGLARNHQSVRCRFPKHKRSSAQSSCVGCIAWYTRAKRDPRTGQPRLYHVLIRPGSAGALTPNFASDFCNEKAQPGQWAAHVAYVLTSACTTTKNPKPVFPSIASSALAHRLRVPGGAGAADGGIAGGEAANEFVAEGVIEGFGSASDQEIPQKTGGFKVGSLGEE
jgi:hypothetical protein